MTRFHLAQANIGRTRAPLDDPIMEGFRTQLDPINAMADRTPGFVSRLQTEDGNAMAIRPYADERMAINMSVWESLDALQQFVYKSAHVGPLRDRKQWFEPIEGQAVSHEVYAELLRSYDEGVAEFLDLERVKPNTLGNTRMLRTL